MAKAIDLTNQRFGKLIVIERDGSQSGHAKWKCLCDCGNYTSVISNNLKQGKITSCGCIKKEKQKQWGSNTLIDLTGQHFGELTVLERAIDKEKEKKLTYKKIHPIWKCQCSCGNICYYFGNQLKRGGAKSCGHIISFGNYKIANILQENKILFQKEYPIQYNGKNYRFDFALVNKQNYPICLIEYDGQQHFYYTNNGWNTQQQLEKTQISDEIKNNWCKQNNIPLIRISYLEYNLIDYNFLKQKFLENNIIIDFL